MSIHTIFGDASPGVIAPFVDGVETTTGQVFQIAATDLIPWQIAGGRLWMSPITPKGAQAVISLSLGADTANPIREVQFTTPQTEGWFDVPWEPYIPAKGSPHTVSIRFPGRVDYLAAPSPTDSPIASETLPALSIYGVGSSPPRSVFRYGNGAGGNSGSGPLWGLDVIVSDGEPLEEEPPANQIPVADGGPNRNVYVGQPVTLTGSGNDADGTITDHLWSQISGPSVALGGEGAVRTFTPSTPGSYVFALSVRDDDGEYSVPDTVVITVLAVPVEQPEEPPSAFLKPFGMVERALKQALIARMPEVEGKIGGDLSFDAAEDDFYVYISLVPGGGNGEVFGEWAVDIDVFDHRYTPAMRRALEIEAMLLTRGGLRTPEMRLDFGYQNVYPVERPWDDESSARVGATYVFTARRPG